MIKNASIKIAVKIKPTPVQFRIVECKMDEPRQILIKLPGDDESQRMSVDLIHDANLTDQSIFQTCQMHSLIAKYIEGYNVTIITYGQTGSGKTFALEGDKNTSGIISKAIENIYKNRPSEDALIKCSFVQLYNEKISDMLSHQAGSLQKGLKIRWQAQRQFAIEDLIEKQCATRQEMQREWNFGTKNRVFSSNKIHDYSSRSHSIFIVTMEDYDEEKNYRSRQIMFVDLAGSERVFSPVGRLSKEAIQINKSLFFLRKVILTLDEINSSGKQAYVPYRDSKLTSVLKKAFGGNCLTLLIACVDGHSDFFEQTYSTLQYAVSAGKIKNQVNVNIDLKSREIRELKLQNDKLKRQLQMAATQIQLFKSIEREQQVKRRSNSQYANRIIQCIGTVRQLLKSNKDLRQQLQRQRNQKKKLQIEMEELQKNYKKAKKAVYLEPVQDIIESKNKQKEFRIFPQSVKSTKNAAAASLDLKTTKQKRESSVIRRRKFLFHERQQHSTERLQP